jgi:hypothetical protein
MVPSRKLDCAKEAKVVKKKIKMFSFFVMLFMV